MLAKFVQLTEDAVIKKKGKIEGGKKNDRVRI